MKVFSKQFVILSALVLLSAACGKEEPASVETGQTETSAPAPAAPEASEAPIDGDSGEVVLPADSAQEMPENSGNPPAAAPAVPPAAANPVPGGPPIGLVPAGRVVRDERDFDLNATVEAGPHAVLRDTDVSQSLEKIYTYREPTRVFPDGTEYLAANTRIRPLSGASVRFFKSNSAFGRPQSFIEINFEVEFGNAIDYVPEADASRICALNQTPGAGSYRPTYRTDWVEFNLNACSASGGCRSVIHGIQPDAACDPAAPSCLQSYQVRVDAASLPGGSIAASHHYVVEVAPLDPSFQVDRCGNATLCSGNSECSGNYPYCEAGLCAGAHQGDYYRAVTPVEFN